MKKIILLLVAAVGFMTFTYAKSGNWLDGNWEGTGYQIDGKTWTVEFSKADNTLTIQYPSLGCGGNWKITSSSKNRIDLEETITTGTDKCDQGCKIIIFKIDDQQISVVYSLPSYQKNAIAYAVLIKK
jgi:hypothetical protein